MHRLLLLALTALLAACTSTLVRHRMQAAQRKLVDARRLQQAGDWPAALAMAERLHGSVAKSIASRPLQPGPGNQPVDLRPLLTAWEQGPYAQLRAALQRQDEHQAGTAFAALRQQCLNCHLVAGKATITIPELP